MPSIKILFILLISGAMISCSQKKAENAGGETQPEATSFSGKPLFVKAADSTALAKSDSAIAAIRGRGELTEDDYVQIGKYLVATARYRMSVDNYTEGLKKFPDSYKLLRNRGHRYITLRQIDNAMSDLTRAKELIGQAPDEMETGLDGKPTATVRHQIWYHIGVGNYLLQNYAGSAEAFENALSTAGDPKNIVGASDWLYNCYQRLGQPEKALHVIQPITESYLDDKEQPYFKRILLYKGIIAPDQLTDLNKDPGKMTVQEITLIYGLANWYGYQGQKEKAQELYKIILQSTAWQGFAYAAAEKDVAP